MDCLAAFVRHPHDVLEPCASCQHAYAWTELQTEAGSCSGHGEMAHGNRANQGRARLKRRQTGGLVMVRNGGALEGAEEHGPGTLGAVPGLARPPETGCRQRLVSSASLPGQTRQSNPVLQRTRPISSVGPAVRFASTLIPAAGMMPGR